MVSGGMKCVKYILFAFNLILFVSIAFLIRLKIAGFVNMSRRKENHVIVIVLSGKLVGLSF